jgi:ABC-type uncharacterized transport system substrate-binding protein
MRSHKAASFRLAILAAVVVALVLPLTASGAKKLRIAMVLWRGETAAEKGFRDGLKDLGYQAEYVVMNAGQDRGELGRLLREDLKPKLDGLDYVYVFGTTATLATRVIVQDKVPLIYNVVADPVGAGIVKSADTSGGNVAGVTNEIPLGFQLETALKVIPIRRLGVFFNPREKNSMLVRDKIQTLAAPLKIEIVDLRSPPAQDMLHENLKKLRDGSLAVDAVYLPADSFIVSNAKLLGEELRTAKVKSIGAIETYVERGALLGIVPEYQELGRLAASIVHRHQGGQRLQDMPVLGDREPVLMINGGTSRALGVTIPDAVRKRAVVVE